MVVDSPIVQTELDLLDTVHTGIVIAESICFVRHFVCLARVALPVLSVQFSRPSKVLRIFSGYATSNLEWKSLWSSTLVQTFSMAKRHTPPFERLHDGLRNV
jgi:hypothetical protein